MTVNREGDQLLPREKTKEQKRGKNKLFQTNTLPQDTKKSNLSGTNKLQNQRNLKTLTPKTVIQQHTSWLYILVKILLNKIYIFKVMNQCLTCHYLQLTDVTDVS